MDGALIILNRLHGIRICKIQLAMAAEDVPGFGVAGLERGATLDDFEFAGMDAMVGEPEPGGLIAQETRTREPPAKSIAACGLHQWFAPRCRNLLRLAVLSQDQC